MTGIARFVRPSQRRRGFSLIELLIVIAIISILLGMYMSTLGKALAKAKKLKSQIGMQQEQVGRMADGANFAVHTTKGVDRDACRLAFHRTLDTSDEPIVVTELRYRVRNDDEFRAYYHTLIDPDATEPLEYTNDGDLVAHDEDDITFFLKPIGDDPWIAHKATENIPIMWEFLSTDMGEMNTNNRGINVAYSDGHTEYIPYGERFPATPLVADLSHRFLD